MVRNGGQFALAVKNWQELFVHKWDTSFKVTEDEDHNDIALNSISYLSTGSSVAALNTFPPGTFPEHRLECTGGECTAVEAKCTNSFVGLGVVCKNYEDITNMQVTTQLPTTSCTPQIKGYPGCTCTDNFTTVTAGSSVLATLLVAVTVLVVLQGVTMIALISTCVVFKRKLKQR